MKFIFLIAVCTLLSWSAQAEPKTCQQVYNLGMEMGCSFSKADQNANSENNSNSSINTKEDDYVVRSTFGPTACKTEELARELIRDLKTECNAWLKERKTDLMTKYQTGSCSEECTNCTMGLKRCSVNGVVHYSK